MTGGHVSAADTSRRLERARRVARPVVQLLFRLRGGAWRARKRLARRTWLSVHGRHAATFALSLDRVATRDQIPELLNRRGLCGAGVEIGVKRGRYSEFLLCHWRGARLVSVDPWREDSAAAYRDRANVRQAEHEAFLDETRRRLARFGERSEIWRTTSLEAASRVADGSLDFVYVDARHDRDSVLADLAAWLPKVRPGGIMAGHDYVDGTFANGDFGVRSAVDAFFGELGFRVHATNGAPRAVEIFPSWIVEVPERYASS